MALTFAFGVFVPPTTDTPDQVYVTPVAGDPLIVTVGFKQVITGVVLITAVGFTV